MGGSRCCPFRNQDHCFSCQPLTTLGLTSLQRRSLAATRWPGSVRSPGRLPRRAPGSRRGRRTRLLRRRSRRNRRRPRRRARRPPRRAQHVWRRRPPWTDRDACGPWRRARSTGVLTLLHESDDLALRSVPFAFTAAAEASAFFLRLAACASADLRAASACAFSSACPLAFAAATFFSACAARSDNFERSSDALTWHSCGLAVRNRRGGSTSRVTLTPTYSEVRADASADMADSQNQDRRSVARRTRNGPSHARPWSRIAAQDTRRPASRSGDDRRARVSKSPNSGDVRPGRRADRSTVDDELAG